MDIIPYHWTRGSDFTFALQATVGTPAGTEIVQAVAKPVAFLGGAPPGDDVPDAVAFTTTYVPAQGIALPHWLFRATAAQSLSLTRGFLVADARISFNDGVILQTQPCYIEVRERVTEQP